MKVAVAQTRPVSGDMQHNIVAHQRIIESAVPSGTDIVVFPELSITGYEPELAKDLAIDRDDQRLDVFQAISDGRDLTIGIGAPTKGGDGIRISLLLFQPRRPRQLYSKMYLHPDEEAFFVCGEPVTGLIGETPKAALAICYELSVPEHAAAAFGNGADIYLASVAKSTAGIDKALARLSQIARDYSMQVLMSNCVGISDGCECAGRSSVWNRQGELLAQLDDANEGIIVADTATQDVSQCLIETSGC